MHVSSSAASIPGSAVDDTGSQLDLKKAVSVALPDEPY